MRRFNSGARQKSQALVSVLIVLTIVLALGAALLFHSRSFRDVTSLQLDTDKAYSLAKSGMGLAEYFEAQQSCGYTMDETYNLGEGSVRIEINTALLENIDGRYVVTGDITSTGSAGRSVRVLEKTIEVEIKGWAKAYGGAGEDEINSLQQTQDRGYILGGNSNSFSPLGDTDFLLLKTDSNGEVQWARTYGGSSYDYLRSLQQTQDGGYILGGNSNSFSPLGDTDFLLLKTDSNGNVQWARTYGGSGSDTFYSLQQTSDGSYILGGRTDSFGAGGYNSFLLKTDSNGEVQWARTYGGSGSDTFYSLQQTSDGSYILGGTTSSFGAGGYDSFLLKTDSNGNVQWARTYGGSSYDDFASLQQTQDGGYLLGGTTSSFGAGDSDFLLVKTDSNGEVQWARTYGGSSYDYFASLQQTSDGGYILSGETRSFGAGGYDSFLLKTDSNGEVQWARTYGGSSHDYFGCLLQTQDGGYLLGGYTNSFGAGDFDSFLVKTDAQGNLDCCSIDMDVTQLVVLTPVSLTPGTVSLTPGTVSLTPGTVSLTPQDVTLLLTTTPVCPD